MIIIKKYKDKVYLSSGLIPYMCKQVIESDNSPVGHKVLCLGNGQLITILEKLLKKMLSFTSSHRKAFVLQVN